MKLSKKRVILLSAVILIALIVSTYFGIKKIHYDIRLANQRDANLMAKTLLISCIRTKACSVSGHGATDASAVWSGSIPTA